MTVVINGTTGIDTVQDGIITNAKIATMAATKLTGQVPDANAPSGSVIQVVQTVKTDTFSTNSTSYVDVTGLSVLITPTNSSNKILVLVNSTFASAFNSSNGGMLLLRDSTSIYQGNAGSGQRQASLMTYSSDANTSQSSNICFLDSPATTSATTYKVQIVSNGGTGIFINRSSNDLANTTGYRTASSITVMEIAA